MNAFILFLANAIKLGIGFLTYLIIARELGAENLGLFSASTSTVSILCYVVDIGINGGMLIMVSKSISRGGITNAVNFVRVNLLFKIFTGVILFALAVWLGNFIGISIYNKKDIILPLQLVFIGIFLILIQDAVDFTLRAYGRFNFYSLFRLISAMSIFLGVLVFSTTKSINLSKTIIAYYWIAPAVTIAISFVFFMPKGILIKTCNILNTKAVFFELVSFSKWLFVGGLSEGIARNINILTLTRMVSLREVGIYDVALKLSDIMEVFSATSSALLLTSASSLLSKEDGRRFIIERTRILGIFSIVIILVIPFSYYIIKALFGESYLLSAGIFKILVIGSIFEILSQPFLYTLYSLEKPDKVAAVRIILSVFSVIIAIILISIYNVNGAAISLLISRFIGLIVFGKMAWKLMSLNP